MQSVCVALKAHMGWTNAVVVGRSDYPVPLHIARIELVDKSNRLAAEPYHVAAGWEGLQRVEPAADPEQVVRDGCKLQRESALSALIDFRRLLGESQLRWESSVVLTGRGRLGDLNHTLLSHAHIHVAEGEAIRAAIRAAGEEMKIASANQDEKSVVPLAVELLGDDIDEIMRRHRPEGVSKWSKEERLLTLAAWLHHR